MDVGHFGVVTDEGIVRPCPGGGAEDGHGLGREFLAQDGGKARGDAGDEAIDRGAGQAEADAEKARVDAVILRTRPACAKKP